MLPGHTAGMPTTELDQHVRRGVEEKLPELRGRLLVETADVDDLDVTSRVKGNGVILVEVRAKPGADGPRSPTTVTFELQPTVQDGEVTYRATEIDDQTGGI